MNTLAKRWITALIAVPLIILLILFGSTLMFSVFIGLMVILSVMEYVRMCFGGRAHVELIEGILLSMVILIAASTGKFPLLAASVSGAVIISFISYLFQLHSLKDQPDISVIGKKVLGFIAIPLLMSHLMMIRALPDGIVWILLLFLIAAVGDIAAFFVGSTYGKRKLMPTVSPGKSWEGAIASIVGSLVSASVYKYFLMPDIAMTHIVALSLIANILAQMGDLSESLIKRSAGAKDSGSIFPGHGGVLDRLDAFLFSAPFMFYYKITSHRMKKKISILGSTGSIRCQCT